MSPFDRARICNVVKYRFQMQFDSATQYRRPIANFDWGRGVQARSGLYAYTLATSKDTKFFRVVRIWNSLPVDIVDFGSLGP